MKTSAKNIAHPGPQSTVARVNSIDWTRISADLDAQGCAVIEKLLAPQQCIALAALYPDDGIFVAASSWDATALAAANTNIFPIRCRSDRGVASGAVCAASKRRQSLERGDGHRHPLSGNPPGFSERCHAAGQTRPTPLLLQYGEGDYNCLHQDLYGEHVFPLQMAILLSEPGRDFSGGEFVLTEQRPRMQSRPEVVPLRQGDAVVFAVHHRPVQGTRGFYRVNLRHGVSRIRSGKRHTMGVIFHDAK